MKRRRVIACAGRCSAAQEALNLDNTGFKMIQKWFWFDLRNYRKSRKISNVDDLAGLLGGFPTTIWYCSTPEQVWNLRIRGVVTRCYNVRYDLLADLCGSKRHGDEVSISLKCMTIIEVNNLQNVPLGIVMFAE